MRWGIVQRIRKVGSILEVSGEVAAMAALLVIVGGGAWRDIRGGAIAKLGDGSQVSGATFVGRVDDDANVTIWR